MKIVYKKDNVYTCKKESFGECYVDDDFYVHKKSNNKYNIKSVYNFLGEPKYEHTITKKTLDKYFKSVKNKTLDRDISDVSEFFCKGTIYCFAISLLILVFGHFVYESLIDIIINIGLLIICIEFLYFKVLDSIKKVAIIKKLDFNDVCTHKIIVLPIAYVISFFLFLILNNIVGIINAIIKLIKYLCTLIIPTVYVLGILALLIILLIGFIKINEMLSQLYINKGKK